MRRLLAVTLALALAGCGSTNGGSAAAGLDHVVYVDAFGGVGRDAFAYVAKEKGFFKSRGIDVEIQHGSGTDTNLKALAARKAEFAALDGTGGILAAGANRDAPPYRIIGQVHTHTLASIITLDPTIGSFKDLEGRVIGMNPGGANEKLFPGLAKVVGFDVGKVRVVNAKGPALVSLLISGKVDALSTFLVQQPLVEAKARENNLPVTTARVLPYSTYMSDPIGTAIFATDKVIAENPGLVKRFQEAILEGLRYTALAENFDDSANIMHKYEAATSVAAAKGEILVAAPYIASPDGVGSVTQSRITKVIAICASNGLMVYPRVATDVVYPELVPVI